MPEKHAYTINNRRLQNGQWVSMDGVEIPLENGVGISQYQELIYIDEDRMFNPATGDVLLRTKKDKEQGISKHYYSKDTGVFVNVWLVQGVDGET
jgi:hypothetical protein